MFSPIKRPTMAFSRRTRNLETIQVSRMKSTLFAVGCMALLGCAFPKAFNSSQAALFWKTNKSTGS